MSSDKFHVGFLRTGRNGGGAERVMLAAALIARGHSADLVGFVDFDENPYRHMRRAGCSHSPRAGRACRR